MRLDDAGGARTGTIPQIEAGSGVGPHAESEIHATVIHPATTTYLPRLLREIGMMWMIRYLTYPPAQRLLRECAAQTLAEYGGGAVRHLQSEIDPGTPPSGRLLIWLIIREVRKQARRR
jgi:hypothetical protein